MLYKEKPERYNPKFEIAGCLIETAKKILLLHRQDHKPQGNTWGVPAGKRDTGEDLLTTIAREVKEETGIQIERDTFTHLDTYYTRFTAYDFTYHQFFVSLSHEPKVQINPQEHKAFLWITPQEALSLPLIEDLPEIIKLRYFA
jgi:8-oxo-dGTP pyrophosphatase MutT (NUDIX family)